MRFLARRKNCATGIMAANRLVYFTLFLPIGLLTCLVLTAWRFCTTILFISITYSSPVTGLPSRVTLPGRLDRTPISGLSRSGFDLSPPPKVERGPPHISLVEKMFGWVPLGGFGKKIRNINAELYTTTKSPKVYLGLLFYIV